MVTGSSEETPLCICREDSPYRRSSDGESTGYSTDYSTFGAHTLRSGRRSSSSLVADTLPERLGTSSRGDRTTYGTYPRSARSAVGSSNSEEEHELTAASTDGGLARNPGNCRAADGSDYEEEDSEREDKEDVMRDEPRDWPSAVNCSLIPSCAIRQCKCLDIVFIC